VLHDGRDDPASAGFGPMLNRIGRGQISPMRAFRWDGEWRASERDRVSSDRGRVSLGRSTSASLVDEHVIWHVPARIRWPEARPECHGRAPRGHRYANTSRRSCSAIATVDRSSVGPIPMTYHPGTESSMTEQARPKREGR
jgi:hypothetical protein